MKRGFLDRDFIETPEGFLFCVVGPYHPKDRVIAYLKYVPSEEGFWSRKGKSFSRVMKAYTIPNLLETFKLLKKKHPKYLFYSSYYNIIMTAVPLKHIKKHYKPEKKLTQLLKRKELDSLQHKVVEFVKILSEKSGVQLKSFGVTGSVLLDMHDVNFSDMDVTVYGLKDSFRLKESMTEVYSSNSGVSRFKDEFLRVWCKSKVSKHPLGWEDALKIYSRKWNIGIFKGTPFSIHPIKTRSELNEDYEDKTYYPKGFVAVKAEVEDNSDSIFLPAIYKVCKVKFIEGIEREPILEIASYESLYDSLAENGEKIIARGKLELVKDNRSGEEYYRILVGSPEGKGREFIKPV